MPLCDRKLLHGQSKEILNILANWSWNSNALFQRILS